MDYWLISGLFVPVVSRKHGELKPTSEGPCRLQTGPETRGTEGRRDRPPPLVSAAAARPPGEGGSKPARSPPAPRPHTAWYSGQTGCRDKRLNDKKAQKNSAHNSNNKNSNNNNGINNNNSNKAITVTITTTETTIMVTITTTATTIKATVTTTATTTTITVTITAFTITSKLFQCGQIKEEKPGFHSRTRNEELLTLHPLVTQSIRDVYVMSTALTQYQCTGKSHKAPLLLADIPPCTFCPPQTTTYKRPGLGKV
ncbi:hypothetical protein PoB_004472800 [Plakobranchus ocellatus]|uniref:Uncharacterized protein n=1 Tax=Plakobranchus ocellatus TaxID=259542 RepID=A0AAV4BHA1_9GAST|nr:hypothetical protein PoB_004472800 [Plakobranchus ocellatus]